MRKDTKKMTVIILVGLVMIAVVSAWASWANSRELQARAMGEVFKSHEEFAEFSHKRFKVGTPRSYAEDVLINNGNGKIYEDKEINFQDPYWTEGYGKFIAEELKAQNVKRSVSYSFPANTTFGFNWRITFYYNAENQLQQIDSGNLLVLPEPHYPNSNTENQP